MTPEMLILGTLAFLSGVFCSMAALFMKRAAHTADILAKEYAELQRVERRIDQLELDFGEKWNNTMRKITARQSMRERRSQLEESEGLNKPNGGILMNGLT